MWRVISLSIREGSRRDDSQAHDAVSSRLTRPRNAMVQVPVNPQATMGASPFNEVLLLRGQFE
ncbi:MAG TPA: hypothetical protein PKV55_13905, partial [Nitrospira sp.]|nr:hypothetical protein [Nitrospira sp.]